MAQRPARYAAVFREAGSAPVAGAVIVEDDRLRLQGRRGARTVELDLPWESLREARVGRRAGERLNGRATIILSREDGADLQIEPLGAGVVGELTDLLKMLAGSRRASRRVVVRVPLKRGAAAAARELVLLGPPFDSAELGLERHEVYMGADEAIFVLQGRGVRETLADALRDPRFWRTGLAWRRLLAGAPELVVVGETEFDHLELVYRWP